MGYRARMTCLRTLTLTVGLAALSGCGSPAPTADTGSARVDAHVDTDAAREIDAATPSLDAGTEIDADLFCAEEARFTCRGRDGVLCCHGRAVSFVDGPCLPGPDVGSDAAWCFMPRGPIGGCACDPDAGTSACDGYVLLTCASGIWRPTPYACDPLLCPP